MSQTPAPKSPLSTPLPWEEVAAAYADRFAPLSRDFAASALDLAAVASGKRIVDVACGNGALALLAAARGAKVAALDFAPAMIARLQADAKAQGLVDVQAVTGDGQHLPWAAASFEAAFSLFGLVYFYDRAQGFAELRRVLVSGGRAVVASWGALAEEPVFARLFELLSEIEPRLTASAASALATPAAYKKEMSACGFRDIRVQNVTHSVDFVGVKAFWEFLQATSAPMVLAKKALGEQRYVPIAAWIGDSLVDTFGPGPKKVAFPALMAIAIV